MERVHSYFSGTVQGVGFRYTVLRTAQRTGILGWVRNRSDGRVELEAEGERAALEQFLGDIETEMNGYISERKTEWLAAGKRFNEFLIVATV